MKAFSFRIMAIVLPLFTSTCYSQLSSTSNLCTDCKVDESSIKFVIDHFNEMGKDDSSILNNVEGEYFNILFFDQKGQCDFRGKRVVFFYGSSGKHIYSKNKFLPDSIDSIDINRIQLTACNRQMLVLPKIITEEFGYDIAVGCAMKLPLTVQHVLKRLRKQTKQCERHIKY